MALLCDLRSRLDWHLPGWLQAVLGSVMGGPEGCMVVGRRIPPPRPHGAHEKNLLRAYSGIGHRASGHGGAFRLSKVSSFNQPPIECESCMSFIALGAYIRTLKSLYQCSRPLTATPPQPLISARQAITPVKKMLSRLTIDSPQQLAQKEEAKRMGSPLAARMSVGSCSTNR